MREGVFFGVNVRHEVDAIVQCSIVEYGMIWRDFFIASSVATAVVVVVAAAAIVVAAATAAVLCEVGELARHSQLYVADERRQYTFLSDVTWLLFSFFLQRRQRAAVYPANQDRGRLFRGGPALHHQGKLQRLSGGCLSSTSPRWTL